MDANLNIDKKTTSKEVSDFFDSIQNRSFLVGGITFFFILLFLIFGIIPAYSEVFTQLELNRKIDEVIVEAETKVQSLSFLTSELNSNQNIVNYLNSIFPIGLEQETPIIMLLDLANRFNVNISSLNFVESPDNNFDFNSNGPNTVVIQFNMLGEKDDVLDFVQELENSRMIFSINNISFSRLQNERNSEDEEISRLVDPFSTNMSVTIFYWDTNVVE